MAWNHPKQVRLPQPSNRRPFKWLIAITLGCSIVLISVYLLVGVDTSPDGRDKTARNIINKSNSHMLVKEESFGKVRVALEKVDARRLAEDVAIPSSSSNRIKLIARPDTNVVERTFQTGTEQLLSWVFTCEVGDPPMPMPPIGESDRKNLVSILISKNKITDSDDELTQYSKESVDYAKKEMAEFIADGGDPDDFLQHYYQELSKAYEVRQEALLQAVQLHNEDPSLCRDFLVRVNEKLSQDGIKKIPEDSIDKIFNPDQTPETQTK